MSAMTERTAVIDTTSPLAGKPAPKDMLVDLARLEREYYARTPDMEDPS
jgi:phosphoglucomutase